MHFISAKEFAEGEEISIVHFVGASRSCRSIRVRLGRSLKNPVDRTSGDFFSSRDAEITDNGTSRDVQYYILNHL